MLSIMNEITMPVDLNNIALSARKILFEKFM